MQVICDDGVDVNINNDGTVGKFVVLGLGFGDSCQKIIFDRFRQKIGVRQVFQGQPLEILVFFRADDFFAVAFLL